MELSYINSYSASTSVIPNLISRLMTDLNDADYPPDEIEEIILSMDEAITNAVQSTIHKSIEINRNMNHASDITVRYKITDDEFNATIIDHGEGFDFINVFNCLPDGGSCNYYEQIIKYSNNSVKEKMTVRLNGEEIKLKGIGAGLKIILNFMDCVTIDLIDKKKILSHSVSEYTDGTILNMTRKRRYF